MLSPRKPKPCKVCGKMFTPFQITKVCSYICALKLNRENKIDAKVAEIKEKLKDHKYWTKLLQATFNTYIRLRDKGKPCICCEKPLGKVYHAGHFFSCGAFPGLRFDEDNCHGQREDCNLHKHGNTGEYAINLPRRIGKERFAALYERRKEVKKLSIPEIQELIKHYKEKIKELK